MLLSIWVWSEFRLKASQGILIRDADSGHWRASTHACHRWESSPPTEAESVLSPRRHLTLCRCVVVFQSPGPVDHVAGPPEGPAADEPGPAPQHRARPPTEPHEPSHWCVMQTLVCSREVRQEERCPY